MDGLECFVRGLAEKSLKDPRRATDTMNMNNNNDQYSVRANAERNVAIITLATRVGLEASMGGASLHTMWPDWMHNSADDFENLYS